MSPILYSSKQSQKMRGNKIPAPHIYRYFPGERLATLGDCTAQAFGSLNCVVPLSGMGVWPDIPQSCCPGLSWRVPEWETGTGVQGISAIHKVRKVPKLVG